MKFREMRRKRQSLPLEECVAVLEKMTAGVLAVHGDEGYPYAVPVSFVYEGGKIYFHTAKAGHKVDAIMRDEKVSFCVVERDEVHPAEFTTYFRSVIAFGRARVLTDQGEKRAALELLARKYSSGEPGMEAEIAKGFDNLLMVAIEVEHLSGKESIELVRAKTRRNRPQYTPDMITSLEPDEVFVFGSNLAGMHGGGAARVAYEEFGAVMGQGVGLQGQSYAIPTMQGGVETIRPYVDEFIAFAKAHPEKVFYVTRIGCGIAGFRDSQIAPLFAGAMDLDNVILPESFVRLLR